MLDGSAARSDEDTNVENNNPVPVITGGDGLNKTRPTVLKRGGRKLRAPLQHQKPPRSANVRLADHNNNSLEPSTARPTTHTGADVPAGPPPATVLQQLIPGTKKELLKSRGVRLERAAVPPGGVQPARNGTRRSQSGQNVNARGHKLVQPAGVPHSTKKNDSSGPRKPRSPHQLPREQKKPLHVSSNVKIVNTLPLEVLNDYLKDGEKVYAGAKFSEPPSPSVLPKPPSHWVGEDQPQRRNHSREQMTVHLKSLLKVPDQA